PPTPPLFPYTTLFRSEIERERHVVLNATDIERRRRDSVVEARCGRPTLRLDGDDGLGAPLRLQRLAASRVPVHERRTKWRGEERSEEHTSELQSREKL